jgi:long-chain acyl-CoA synthetase
MISPATWTGGALQPRASEWLATGDLAEAQSTGELRFIGRKSETIVTGSGVNLHPEDLEAAFEQEPQVAACAVVPVETPLGPEPCAVLALRGSPEQATAILQSANTRLAEFQRIRRFALWPEPDLPRTSTGKVKRAAVTAWLANQKPEAERTSPVANTDWLLSLIARITGEGLPAAHATSPNGDLRLAEDLRLDSLGRVQLLDALEERLGVALNQEEYATVETLNQLRHFATHPATTEAELHQPIAVDATSSAAADTHELETPHPPAPKSIPAPTSYIYPHWPWLLPFRWIRTAFTECVMRPLVWLLAAPRVISTNQIQAPDQNAPMLIIANHVTAYDESLLLYALPRAIRDHAAVAMSGEILEDLRHARNRHPRWLNPLGPPAWLLITALFNVFPLPRQRDFQRSFAHAGQALDRGFHVIIFPEGTRSPDGALANFRPGIGLLVKQSSAAVLPIALHGLGELKIRRRNWFRSGTIEIRVGQPMRFAATESEAAITARLHAEVVKLLAPVGMEPTKPS